MLILFALWIWTILVCIGGSVNAQERSSPMLELTNRRDHLDEGAIVTTGKIRNISDHTISCPRVFVGHYTDDARLIRYRVVDAKHWWIFPCRRMAPGDKCRFKVRIRYHPEMKRTRIRFHTVVPNTARAVSISHTSIR